MSRIVNLAAGAAALVFACTAAPDSPQRIVVDGSSLGRIFEGLGAVSAGASTRLLIDYPEPYRSQILDYLFKPNYGAALQHLKVEIGGDANSTDGSEPSHARTRAELAHPDFTRGYEWWLMREAKKRNPKILLDGLAWGAPGWIGNGEFFSRDMIEYLLQFIEGARKVHKLDIDYIGVWNEMRYEVAWVKAMKRALAAHDFRTKLVCCDLVPSQHQWSIASEMLNDPELKDAVAAVTAHYTEIDTTGTPPIRPPREAMELGRPLWASEDHPARKFWRDPQENDWQRASRLAKLNNENYIERRFTKTEPWAVITSYYDILPAPNSGLMYASTPWSGNYRVQTSIWATAHTTQFAQPGWRYIDTACGYLIGKGSYVTLRSLETGDYSIVIETMEATGSQQVAFELQGGLTPRPVHVWRTNERNALERIATIGPEKGSVRVTLEAASIYTLTTTTGQGKGSVKPPADSPFPLPYADNFDKTPPAKSPKYWSDQNGTFEVANCAGRPGRCLEQEVLQTPIWWHKTNWNPQTILGDASWTDYQVSADARLEDSGTVALLGRIGAKAYENKPDRLWPGAYVLLVNCDGSWQLNAGGSDKNAKLLASGRVAPLQNWHTLGLRFRGTKIEAAIDGATIANVDDPSHPAGMAGIGCGWHRAQFDNFKITRIR